MIQKEITIINKLGLHARAAAKFVSVASRYQCELLVAKDEKQVNGKSIMGVMMLAASQNSIIEITVDGEDEVQALEEIENLVGDRFGEEE